MSYVFQSSTISCCIRGHMDETQLHPETHDKPSGKKSEPGMEVNNCGDGTTNSHEDESGAAAENKPRAWFRYTVEHRERKTNEVIGRFEAPSFESDGTSSVGPVFDFVKTIRVRESDPTNSGSKTRSTMTHLAPEYHIEIHSTAVLNALQSVVDYYPGHDLTADPFIVKWPYAILVHYYEELANFREECAAKEPSVLCVREKDAYEHIGVLLRFLDEQVMEQVNTEKERNKKGNYTFEWYWVAHKPGATCLEKYREDQHWESCVIHSVTGGVFETPSTSWDICVWRMAFDGRYLGRKYFYSGMEKWDGEKNLADATRFIDETNLTNDEMVAERIKIGEKYWQLLRKQCQQFKGPTARFPYNEVNGLVVSDIASFYAQFPDSKPRLMDSSDDRKWSTDCECSVCKQRAQETQRKVKGRFEDYNDIALQSTKTLTPHGYLLCPTEIPAYVFKTRTWELLHVAHFSEPQFNESLIDSLVMNSARVQTLKALSKSFIRVNKDGDKMERPPWAADFVRGKGHGLIFLLHGRPGVGKTCTAECIAEYIQRPLMTLSCSDIGTDPNAIEENLIRNFKLARSWDAVLLIDEADVFMARRSTSDLTRNSLVAGFLRALEFYDGILFLTTNRVGTFDDAFISRIHVQLYYSDFTTEERQLVWKTFTDKLARERGDYIRLNIDAKEYIRCAEVRALKWNGREIRNAFQTAVALAEFEAIKDEENKIVITDNHLRAVVQLSSDFKKYLDDLHKGDEGKRSERKYERLDSYEPGVRD
ncbi:hypothetical protein BDV59DRAFT_174221 [Aspergillus ambiguus]|uniref:ATP-binding protein n=1 Tax=Aspergillus ambiguus TaxID=176160 RepID=UPI003CCD889A